MTKEFIEKYGKKIGGAEIKIVQDLSNDVSREIMAKDMGVEYGAMTERIRKLKDDIGVKSDAALVHFFFQNGLID